MVATTPGEVHRLFERAFAAHDLDALLALYDADAVMVPAPGAEPVRGHAAIRQVLAGFLALEPRDVRLETMHCVERDGLALTRSRWRFMATLPDGATAEMTGEGAEVLRRGADGGWVHLIDHPWGASAT